MVIEPVGQKRRRACCACATRACRRLARGDCSRSSRQPPRDAVHRLLTNAVGGRADRGHRDAFRRVGGAGEVATRRRALGVPRRWNTTARRDPPTPCALAAETPARYGVMKGELKSALKSAVDAPLFDAGVRVTRRGQEIEQQGTRRDTSRRSCRRSRPRRRWLARGARAPARIDRLTSCPTTRGGARSSARNAAGVASLGPHFMRRLVRVTTEFTCTAAQMTRLRASIDSGSRTQGAHGEADLRRVTGASPASTLDAAARARRSRRMDRARRRPTTQRTADARPFSARRRDRRWTMRSRWTAPRPS